MVNEITNKNLINYDRRINYPTKFLVLYGAALDGWRLPTREDKKAFLESLAEKRVNYNIKDNYRKTDLHKRAINKAKNHK